MTTPVNNAPLKDKQHIHADKSKEEAKTAAEAASEAAKEAGKAGQNAAKRAYGYTKGKFNDAGKSIANATAGIRESGSQFNAQVRDAYTAGKASAATTTYARHVNAPPTAGDRVKLGLKFPFTTSSYIAGHVISNESHGVRESKHGVTPSRLTKIAGAAAATWGIVLGLAGMAPSKLGFLIKPIPYSFGTALPNLAAYTGYIAVGLMAAVIAVRVGCAIRDKWIESSESKRINAEAAATAKAQQAATDAAAGETKEAADNIEKAKQNAETADNLQADENQKAA